MIVPRPSLCHPDAGTTKWPGDSPHVIMALGFARRKALALAQNGNLRHWELLIGWTLPTRRHCRQQGMTMLDDEMRIHDLLYDSIGEDPPAFKKLYDAHPSIAKRYPWLYRAARNGDYELVEFLLQSSHGVDEQSGGNSPQSAITAAAGEGSQKCLQLLIDAGASLNVDYLDDNPLFAAIKSYSLQCVALLVEAGIDIQKTYTLEDGRLRNALEFAVSRGCADIADYLRSKGAVMPG